MYLSALRMPLGVSLLVLSLACGSGGSGTSPEAQITLRAQFEKRPLTASGLGAAILMPARYCWAEVREAGTDALVASGYLGSDGTGITSVPRGVTVYAQVYAQYQVPSANPASFFMRGSVKQGPDPISAATPTLGSSAFAAIPVWSVTSAPVTADRDGVLGITALASNRIAGAFNIADQAVTFAAAVRDLEPSSSLRLPNLHTFWTLSAIPADQARTYPSLTYSPSGAYLVSDSGRALFHHAVQGLGSGAPGTETDEWDDGVLQETFARLLFADHSYLPDGSSSLSLLRRDNDNVWVDRAIQSESTAAFVAGYCDFLAGAIRQDSLLLDSYVDAGGVPQVDAFNLASHTAVPTADKGEFTRGSIAVSLWGIWKQALGGGSAGLRTLWDAVRSTTAYADGTGEYEQATLGCYPTYLQGVASRVSTGAWTTALGELALEGIPDPNPSYFAGTALWETRSPGFAATGSLQTYASTYYYDRNQSQAWRFTHGGGARTITMTPTSGQDFYLELLGPGGWVAGSFDQPGLPRTLTFANLPAGVYAARVRAGATTASGLNTYTISVN